MEYFIKTNIKIFSKEDNNRLINKLKSLNADDIFYWCQLTYNVSLSKWYIANKCFKSINFDNAHGFFMQLQPHIRNRKFNLSKEPKDFDEEAEIYLKTIENKFYPKTLIQDFCNYFDVTLESK